MCCSLAEFDPDRSKEIRVVTKQFPSPFTGIVTYLALFCYINVVNDWRVGAGEDASI